MLLLVSMLIVSCDNSSEPAVYAVSFDSNYEGSAESEPIEVAEGEAVDAPADPSRSGYIFRGWYMDAGCTEKAEFPYTVTGDVTFYAGWERNQDIETTPKTATPEIKSAVKQVTITCSTDGATIYYTTDGTEPTSESTLYSAPIDITQTCTVKAIAIKDGYDDSAVSTAECELCTVTFMTRGFMTESRTEVEAIAGTLIADIAPDLSESTQFSGHDTSGWGWQTADGANPDAVTPDMTLYLDIPAGYAEINGTYYVTDETGLKAWNTAGADAGGGNCTLLANITLSKTDNSTANWNPIELNGTFNGNGYEIRKLVSNGGFFSKLKETGFIKNLGLIDVYVTAKEGSRKVAVFADNAELRYDNDAIAGCYATGEVHGEDMIGGTVLISGIVNGDISRIIGCFSCLDLHGGENANIRGIINTAMGSSSACYNAGSINADNAPYRHAIGKKNSQSVCYCSSSISESGVSCEDVTVVDGATTTWAAAAEAMNAELEREGAEGYRYEVNTSETKDEIPLVLVYD